MKSFSITRQLGIALGALLLVVSVIAAFVLRTFVREVPR